MPTLFGFVSQNILADLAYADRTIARAYNAPEGCAGLWLDQAARAIDNARRSLLRAVVQDVEADPIPRALAEMRALNAAPIEADRDLVETEE